MKRMIIAVALVFLMVSITACKKANTESEKILNEFSQSSVEQNEDGSNQIGRLTAGASGYSITLADHSVKTLTFSKTDEFGRIFVDEGKNEFSFDPNGKLTGYAAAQDNANLAEPTSPITKEQAEVVAMKHIKETYGGSLEEYALEQCTDGFNTLQLFYVKCYGDEGLVKGDSCFISVYRNGAIRQSITLHMGKYKDFDETLLDGITKETLEIYARQQAIAAYKDSLLDCQLTDIWLHEQEEGYALSVQATVSYNDGGEPLSVVEEYIYPLFDKANTNNNTVTE